jgi:hypothetical protein
MKIWENSRIRGEAVRLFEQLLIKRGPVAQAMKLETNSN